MRSASEHNKKSDTEERRGYADIRPNTVKKPSWERVEAGENNFYLDKLQITIDRLCIALEKELKNVCKN
jgi:hypothetical protein